MEIIVCAFQFDSRKNDEGIKPVMKDSVQALNPRVTRKLLFHANALLQKNRADKESPKVRERNVKSGKIEIVCLGQRGQGPEIRRYLAVEH